MGLEIFTEMQVSLLATEISLFHNRYDLKRDNCTPIIDISIFNTNKCIEVKCEYLYFKYL